MLSEKEKLGALKISTFAIASVVVVEMVSGLIAGSLAILSDGAHALLDALTMIVLFFTTKASFKPPDDEHMYGHEKIESIGGLIGGIALIGIALLIMYEAILRITQNTSVNLNLESVGFVAIGYTLCIDFIRIGIFRKSTKIESSTVKAGFYHALADFSSTILALLGFGLATIGSYPSGDAVASIVLSILLIYLSSRVVWSSGMELSDAVSKDVAEKVRKEIASTKEVSKIESLRVRKAGTKTFVEAAIKVPDYLGFEESHALASKIEEKLKRLLKNAEVVIHVEPLGKEMPTEKLVEKLAKEVEGVIEANEINVAYAHGKLYITLHARVDPKLSVQEAHELAGKIEDKLNEEIENIENVTVHIEPFDARLQRGPTVDDKEIQQIIYKTAKSLQQVFSVKRIITYVIGGKRYVNIDCCFTSHISIEEAHKVATKIENGVKKKFTETIVTVHMEPKKEDNVF
ncbi:MAG: cation-efflux pump [Candidatus Bathyarchaeia archaeon]